MSSPTSKCVIQVYKAAEKWTRDPPGIGDYVRGLCHLHELGQKRGFEVRADISTTDFWDCVDRTSPIFAAGSPAEIDSTEELNDLTDAVLFRIEAFLAGPNETLYVSTNMGDWQRQSLPDATKAFARQFYKFRDGISVRGAMGLTANPYSVLSVRVGDRFFGSRRPPIGGRLRPIADTVEHAILPAAKTPILVMSDSEAVKTALVRRFGFLATPSPSAHGAKGGAAVVCRDLDLLAHSQTNFHINAWRGWWSGFSHYTSLIFDIPSVNFASVRPLSLPGQLRAFVDRLRRVRT